jgi:hypothetical protein
MSSHPPSKRGSEHSPCAARAPMTYELFLVKSFLIGMVRGGPINLGCVLAVPAFGRRRCRSAFIARDGCWKRNAPRRRGARPFAPSLGSLGNHGRKPARCMHALYENVRFL